MKTSAIIDTSFLPNLSSLRDLLELLASLRDISNPFGSPDGLHAAFQLLEQLGGIVGLDSKWIAWLSGIESNAELFDLVLAAGKYLESIFEPTPPTGSPATGSPATLPIKASDDTAASDAQVQSIDFSKLLPLLAEILQLWQQLRAALPAK
jgi:hypothetical protein